jgi:hypothetical protein
MARTAEHSSGEPIPIPRRHCVRLAIVPPEAQRFSWHRTADAVADIENGAPRPFHISPRVEGFPKCGSIVGAKSYGDTPNTLGLVEIVCS